MFGLCRYCGDELPRARRPLEVCAKCDNLPLCDRCGHERGDHTRVFIHGQCKCNKLVGDFQTGTSSQCNCEGFRPIRGPLSEATFATSRPSVQDDPLAVPLRLAHPR